MTTQPEAMRLADALETRAITFRDKAEAAAELRRLHAVNQELTENLEKKSSAIQRIWKERDELRKVNQELLEALKEMLKVWEEDPAYGAMHADKARAAIAKAEGQA
jgi:thiamine biosynthesis lipoprotein ApbE